MEAVAAVAVRTALPANVTPFPARSALRDVSLNASAGVNGRMREMKSYAAPDSDDLSRLEGIVTARMRVAKGDVLYRSGARFTGLYAIQIGSFKTVLLADDGASKSPATT